MKIGRQYTRADCRVMHSTEIIQEELWHIFGTPGKTLMRMTPKGEVPCLVAPTTSVPSFIQIRPRISEKALTRQTQTNKQQL